MGAGEEEAPGEKEARRPRALRSSQKRSAELRSLLPPAVLRRKGHFGLTRHQHLRLSEEKHAVKANFIILFFSKYTEKDI